MTLHIKESSAWREVLVPSVNVSGTWKSVKEVHIRHGGSWRLSHTTSHLLYNLGSYVVETNVGIGESGSYTIPTGQGIAYINLYVEGQAGGGGGGTYTPSYWPCSSSTVVNTGSPTSNVHMGGLGGLGGTITNIHQVEDGDYVVWDGYGGLGANGEGGAGYNLNVYQMSASTGYPSLGAYTATTGENGFAMTSSIRDSAGNVKSQINAAGGRGGVGSTITLNSTCTSSGFRGFDVTGANGAIGANGQASNYVSLGTGSQSVVHGDASHDRGTRGNDNYTVANSGAGGNAYNVGKIKIKLYTPANY